MNKIEKIKTFTNINKERKTTCQKKQISKKQ